MKKLLSAGLLTVLLFQSAPGQISCPKGKLIGEWKEITSIPGIITNVDSMKQIITKSNGLVGTWDFKPNLTYSYSDSYSNKLYQTNQYLYDEKACQIILGTRKHAGKKTNLEIMYMDDMYLIYRSDNNPKGYYTHLLTRSTKK